MEPWREGISALFLRYEILTPNAIPKGFMDGKQACERMVPPPCPAVDMSLLELKVRQC